MKTDWIVLTILAPFVLIGVVGWWAGWLIGKLPWGES
jgi:hypothetical protein